MGEDVNMKLSMVTSVMDSFASLTEEEDEFSLLPQDLEFTNDVIDNLLELLEKTLVSENETDFETLVSQQALKTQKTP